MWLYVQVVDTCMYLQVHVHILMICCYSCTKEDYFFAYSDTYQAYDNFFDCSLINSIIIFCDSYLKENKHHCCKKCKVQISFLTRFILNDGSGWWCMSMFNMSYSPIYGTIVFDTESKALYFCNQMTLVCYIFNSECNIIEDLVAFFF